MSDNLPALMEYSRALSASDLLPKQYRGNPANVLVAVEYGKALGLSAMAAIQGIHVVEGKPTASAQLIGALVRNAGHRLRVTGDDKQATASIWRADDPEFEFRAAWTIQRAAAAGLTGKAVWKNYPAAMLKARAITEVARDACPEVLSGVAYTEEELGAEQRTTAPPPVPTVTVEQVERVEHLESVDYATGEILDPEPAAPADIEDAVIVDDEPTPAPTGPAATAAQMGKIGALCNALGLSREDRLTFASDVVKRELTSANKLTKPEASKVIEELQAEVEALEVAEDGEAS